jgi:hypothetical protein
MAEAKTTKPRPDDLDGTLWVLYVYEDDEIVIVADRSRRELGNLLRDHETPTRAVANQMSDIAADKTDYDWSDADAIVFPRGKEVS